MDHIYKECDLLISMSDYETFGKAIYQAAAAGMKVIATPTYGMRELEQNLDGFIVIGRNKDDLVAAIETIRYYNFNPQKNMDYMRFNYSKSAVIEKWRILHESFS